MEYRSFKAQNSFYVRTLALSVFVIWTSTAIADKGALVGDSPLPECETALGSEPISKLAVEIINGNKLEREVTYDLQIRVGKDEQFAFSSLKSMALANRVHLEINDMTTFRNNPVWDFTVTGSGRNVAKLLLDLPRMRSGPYWISGLREKATEPKGRGARTSEKNEISISKWNTDEASRRKILEAACSPGASVTEILVTITRYNQPYLVGIKSKLLMGDAAVVAMLLKQANPEIGKSEEDLVKQIEGWQRKKLRAYTDSSLTTLNRPKIILEAAQKNTPIIFQLDSETPEDEQIVLIPI